MGNPLAMFEIMAINQESLIDFYTSVFDWQVERNQDGFAYVHFPPANYSLLGGIGQAKPGITGWGKGITFYIQVDDLRVTLEKVKAHGGLMVVEPVTADGYHFAMFEDPECNLIGIIEPFVTNAAQHSA
jgi:predicted enzyme related to lactoylglutathione lyase